MLQNSTSKQEKNERLIVFPKRSKKKKKKHRGIISIPVKYHAKWGLTAAWLAIVPPSRSSDEMCAKKLQNISE